MANMLNDCSAGSQLEVASREMVMMVVYFQLSSFPGLTSCSELQEVSSLPTGFMAQDLLLKAGTYTF